jgi:DNA-binding GntR family transcriptional regulator
MEIDYPSLSDRVYEVICNQIIEGKIGYGEKLSIKDLSEKLKVSTMPVRDALKKLEMERVVRIKPRSNCIVTVPTKKSIVDAFTMRILLEIHALEVIYANVTPDELVLLKKIVADMEDLIQNDSSDERIRRYIHLDFLFHARLCALAGNEYLKKFFHEVNLHLNMTFIYRIAAPPDIRTTFRDHRRILKLLAENSAEAVDLLRRHLERSMQNMMAGELFRSLE